MQSIFSFFSTPPRNLLDAARWLAIFLPLSLIADGTIIDVLGSVIALLFLAHSLLHKEWGWLKARWLQIAFVLWAYTLLRSLWAEDMEEALGRAASWIRFPLLAAAMAYGVLTDEKTTRLVWVSVCATTLFLIADGLLQYITGSDVFGYTLFDLEGTMRLTGPFDRPKLGIVLVGFAFPAILPLLMGARRWMGVALAAAAIFVIFISGERMALLLCLLGVALVFLLWPGQWRFRLGALAFAIMVIAAGMAMDRNKMQRQLHSSIEVITHFNETPYGMLWQSGLNIAKENPVFGVGPRHFRKTCVDARYGSTEPAMLHARCNLHPHNIYIEWLAETGIVGLSLFIIMLCLILQQLWHGLALLRTDALFIGLCVVFIVRFWPISATASFFASWVATPAWFMAGWALYMANQALKQRIS